MSLAIGIRICFFFKSKCRISTVMVFLCNRRLICEQPNGKTILKILSISEIHSPNLMNNDVKTASIPHLNSKSSVFFSKTCVSGISISFKTEFNP